MEGVLPDSNAVSCHLAFLFFGLAEHFINSCLVDSRCRKPAAYIDYLLSYFLLYLFVLGVGEYLNNKGGNLLHFPGTEASGGYGWCAQSDAAGYLRRPGVPRYGVPVHQNAGSFKRFLCDNAGYAGGGKVNEYKVVVGAAGYQIVNRAVEAQQPELWRSPGRLSDR